jgi:hypothetical protein
MHARAIGLLSCAWLIVGCGSVQPTAVLTPASTPMPSTTPVLAVGILLDELIGAQTTRYRMSDGTTWERANDAFHVLYHQPSGSTLFLASVDSAGPFVMLIGGQDGLPAECRHVLGYGGLDLDGAIDVHLVNAEHDVVLAKAPSFGASAIPSAGVYPETVRFCLDDDARVERAISILRPTPTK